MIIRRLNTWYILISIINPRKPNYNKYESKIIININGQDYSKNQIYNKMNFHFIQIGNKLADKIDDILNKSFLDYLNNRNFNYIILSSISVSEINLAVYNFKPKVSRNEIYL